MERGIELRCKARWTIIITALALFSILAVYVESGNSAFVDSHAYNEIIEHMNANTMVVLQIETRRAVEMREELLAVPGIDAVMMGPADLSISLGVPGEFQHPRMVEAMEAVRDSCDRRGIAPGTQTRTPALARFWKDRGMRFLGCSNETGMIYERAMELVQQISAESATR